MGEILVSCIMPTGNRQHLIGCAIESFFKQTVSDTELIIVDDGSVPTVILDNPRIRYFRVSKRTIGEKLNFACEQAKGKIICRWDDDDWYSPSRISRQLADLQQPGIQVTGFHSLHYYDMKTGGIWPITLSHPLPHAMGTSLCFTKAYWRNNPFLAINRYEDTAFSNRAQSQRVLSSYDGKPYVVARKHGGNISTFEPVNPPTNKRAVPQEFLKRLGDQMGSNPIIQSFWSGTLTAMEKLCIRSFIANGHEFHLYAYGKLEGVPEGCVVKDANDIIPESKIRQLPCVQQWADFFRAALLLKKGGWWVDMDTVCLKPYDFAAEYVFAGCDSDTVIQNCVIKVPSNSPIMQAWYDHINDKNAAQLAGLAFQEVGPELCAKLVPKFGLQQYVLPRITFDPIGFDRVHHFVDPSAVWDLSRTYSIHCFHAAWRGQHESLQRKDYAKLTGTDDKFPEGCLYEQLKRRFLRTPKVSIVITTYNRAKQLEATLNSIENQPYKDYEVIVIDDGMDAATPALCKAHGVDYVHVGRSGVYRNPAQPINIGLRRAVGDIVILQNAECKHSDPNTIERLISQVTDNNAVFSLVMDLLEDGRESGIYYCGKLAQRPLFFCGAMKRSWFVRLRGMDEDYPCGGYDDNDFADRLKREGVNIVFSDIVVHHQWHHRPPYSTEAALQVYREKSAAMVSGKITTVRNLGREWGALEPREVPLTWTFKPTPLPMPIPSPSVPRPAGRYKDASCLTIDWWDTHRR